MLIGQAETAVVTELIAELAKNADKTAGGAIIYIFVIVIALFFIGFFFVLRYVIQHTKDVHNAANANIEKVSTAHKETCTILAESFTTGTDLIMKDSIAQREQHHKDMIIARDLVHASRDAAQSAVSQRELNDALAKARQQQKD